MKERLVLQHKSIQVVSLSLAVIIVCTILNQTEGSPFPEPTSSSSWFFSGPGLQQQHHFISHQQQNQQTNPYAGGIGNSGNCHQMNIPCSGHTKGSCLNYCQSIGFPYSSCAGSCCLCSHFPLEPDHHDPNQHQVISHGYIEQPRLGNTQSELNKALPLSSQPPIEDLETAESRHPNLPKIIQPNNGNSRSGKFYWNANKFQQPWQNNNFGKNSIHTLGKPRKNGIDSRNSTSSKKHFGVCKTDGCVKAAKRMSSNMNPKASPCTNFYEYACGGFLKNTHIPPDQTEVTPFTTLRNKVSEQLKALFEEHIKPNEAKPFQLAKTLYKSCMDTGRLNHIGTESVTKVLDQIGGWPVLDPTDQQQQWSSELFTWSNYVVWFRELGFSHDIFMKLSVDPDIKNVKRRVITVGEPALGLSREVLLSGMSDPSVQAYYKYMVDTALLFGADKPTAEKEMLQVLNFEISLARIFHRPEGTRAGAYYLPVTISEMELKHASVPWLELFQRVVLNEVTGNQVVIISAPHYIDAFFSMITSVRTETIANYAVWRLIASSMSYLGDSAKRLQFEFVTATTGQKSSVARWKECSDVVLSGMGNAVGAMYIRRYFPTSAKSEAKEMIRNIHSAFIDILDEVDWMDALTRGKAKEKALGISVHVGYPEEHLNDTMITQLYSEYNFTQNEYLGNIRNLVRSANNMAFRKLPFSITRNDWITHGKNAAVNAFYLPLDNAIQFPAGILQNPFFDSRRPRYMNYGAIGWVIGHEVTHGFDDQGHQFDKDGNYANWWDPFTKQTYTTKTKCIINQYGKFSPTGTGLKLNGINSQGENIADNGGIKQAYRGYQSWVRKHGVEETLPGFEGLTPNQLFWISAASNWCAIHRPETLRTNVLTGVHSPGEFRVKGTFANNADFAADFSCPRGSPMNPDHKCSVW